MGIRQALNENRTISVGVTAVVIVLALVVILWECFGTHRHAHVHVARAFYSDDDGKTWFADDANKRTPFGDSNNKQAVQAFVFKCGGEPFVGYLLRATDSDASRGDAPHGRGAPDPTHSEVKKPGANRWVRYDPRNTAPYLAVTQSFPQCPAGNPQPVLAVSE